MTFFGLFKKKKKIDPLKDIPPEILADFNLAEKIMSNSGGEAKPYKILFNIAMKNKRDRMARRDIENDKTRRDGEIVKSRASKELDSAERILPRSNGLAERSSLQTPVNPVDRQKHSVNQQLDKPNVKSNGWGIFRRRNRTVSKY